MKKEQNSSYDFTYITDNSAKCDENGAFFLTKLNERYLNDAKQRGCTHILNADEVSQILGIKDNMKIIGITGTNGKTTTAAAIYSLLLDLDIKVALQGTRGCFINDTQIAKKA